MKVTVELVKQLLPEAIQIVESATGEKVYRPEVVELFPSHSIWGQVQYLSRARNKCKLRISSYMFGLLSDEEGLLELKKTLVHECCHMMPNGHGHGKYFKARAEKINAIYPWCDVQRLKINATYNKAETALYREREAKRRVSRAKVKVSPAYKMICRCGWSYPYSRWSKNFDRLHVCSCPICHRRGEWKVLEESTGKIIRNTIKAQEEITASRSHAFVHMATED